MNALTLYRLGSEVGGWCCIRCNHRHPLMHRGRPARTFVRLVVHRALAHRRFRFEPYTGELCEITHTTGPRQFQFTWTFTAASGTGTWTAS